MSGSNLEQGNKDEMLLVWQIRLLRRCLDPLLELASPEAQEIISERFWAEDDRRVYQYLEALSV